MVWAFAFDWRRKDLIRALEEVIERIEARRMHQQNEVCEEEERIKFGLKDTVSNRKVFLIRGIKKKKNWVVGQLV